MKRIFVCLLGEWTQLTEGDTIFNTEPHTWLKENNIGEYEFLKILCGGTGYEIHKSHLQVMG